MDDRAPEDRAHTTGSADACGSPYRSVTGPVSGDRNAPVLDISGLGGVRPVDERAVALRTDVPGPDPILVLHWLLEGWSGVRLVGRAHQKDLAACGALHYSVQDII